MDETLDPLATKIDEPVDQWLEQSDKRFDELMAYLTAKIDAVGSKLDLVLERMDELLKRDVGNSAALERGERQSG